MSSLRRRNAMALHSQHPNYTAAFGSQFGSQFGRGPRRRSAFKHSMALDYGKDLIMEDKEEHGLTQSQVEAFHEVFNLFDINGGGTIDADELDAALKAVDIQLTHEEITDVLHVIDEDGNGEIDFNEFLTLMTSTEKYLETLRGESGSGQKENVLFSALTKFMRKSALSSLSEIERYYNMKVRKSPHVVGHYAAGARLIGLTEKQMAKHLATLSVTGGKDNDSPYAQPLCMFTTNLPNNIKRMTRTHGKIKLTVVKAGEETMEHNEKNDGKVENSSSATPNMDQSGEADPDKKPASAPASSSHTERKLQRLQRSPLRLRPTSVPLPAVSVKRGKDLTIEDLPMIRERVDRAYEIYRKKQEAMHGEIAQNATFTDLSAIPSRTLQLQFKLILEAYNFRPTNVPQALVNDALQHLPWHMAY